MRRWGYPPHRGAALHRTRHSASAPAGRRCCPRQRRPRGSCRCRRTTGAVACCHSARGSPRRRQGSRPAKTGRAACLPARCVARRAASVARCHVTTPAPHCRSCAGKTTGSFCPWIHGARAASFVVADQWLERANRELEDGWVADDG